MARASIKVVIRARINLFKLLRGVVIEILRVIRPIVKIHGPLDKLKKVLIVLEIVFMD